MGTLIGLVFGIGVLLIVDSRHPRRSRTARPVRPPRLAGLLQRAGMPDVAPLRSAADNTLEDYRNDSIRMLCVAGLSGFPQLSMPLAQRDGAPLGISLLGPAGSDRGLVALAERIAA